MALSIFQSIAYYQNSNIGLVWINDHVDLNLLGLMVHLDRIVLDITAQSGPGNLLGNLLCAVAGLLDHNGPLAGIANLLNQILGQL